MSDFRGGRYGEAGKGLGSDGAASKFGKSAQAGIIGERYVSNAINGNSLLRRYAIWHSMRIPTPARGTRYSGDVDIALASGNSLILVDVKMWAAGKFYWTFFGRPMSGLTPMKDKMSRNMELAVARYREALPGHKVTGIVIFAPTRNGKMPTSVGLLRWPGGIKSYMTNDGFRKIQSFLGDPSPVSTDIQRVAGNMTK